MEDKFLKKSVFVDYKLLRVTIPNSKKPVCFAVGLFIPISFKEKDQLFWKIKSYL